MIETGPDTPPHCAFEHHVVHVQAGDRAGDTLRHPWTSATVQSMSELPALSHAPWEAPSHERPKRPYARGRRFDYGKGEVLVGLKAIGAYFGRPKVTAYRWIKAGWLPAMRLPNGQWMTTRTLIDKVVLVQHDKICKDRKWGRYSEKEIARAAARGEPGPDD